MTKTILLVIRIYIISEKWERSMSSYMLSSCSFNLYAEYFMQNARLDEAQVRIKIAGRKINNLKYADDTTLMAKVKRN